VIVFVFLPVKEKKKITLVLFQQYAAKNCKTVLIITFFYFCFTNFKKRVLAIDEEAIKGGKRCHENI